LEEVRKWAKLFEENIQASNLNSIDKADTNNDQIAIRDDNSNRMFKRDLQLLYDRVTSISKVISQIELKLNGTQALSAVGPNLAIIQNQYYNDSNGFKLICVKDTHKTLHKTVFADKYTSEYFPDYTYLDDEKRTGDDHWHEIYPNVTKINEGNRQIDRWAGPLFSWNHKPETLISRMCCRGYVESTEILPKIFRHQVVLVNVTGPTLVGFNNLVTYADCALDSVTHLANFPGWTIVGSVSGINSVLDPVDMVAESDLEFENLPYDPEIIAENGERAIQQMAFFVSILISIAAVVVEVAGGLIGGIASPFAQNAGKLAGYAANGINQIGDFLTNYDTSTFVDDHIDFVKNSSFFAGTKKFTEVLESEVDMQLVSRKALSSSTNSNPSRVLNVNPYNRYKHSMTPIPDVGAEPVFSQVQSTTTGDTQASPWYFLSKKEAVFGGPGDAYITMKDRVTTEVGTVSPSNSVLWSTLSGFQASPLADPALNYKMEFVLSYPGMYGTDLNNETSLLTGWNAVYIDGHLHSMIIGGAWYSKVSVWEEKQ
jgi:hypothetical protein